MRSPSKGKVVGSIPAEALPFLFFYASHLFSFSFVVWSRGAMETRLPPKQKIVGSTPTGIVFYVIAFYSLLNLFLFFFFFLFSFFLSTFYFIFFSCFLLFNFSFFLSFFFRVTLFFLFIFMLWKQEWPSGLRRQFKVLFSSEAWVRTPPLAFLLFLFSSPIYYNLVTFLSLFMDGLLA